MFKSGEAEKIFDKWFGPYGAKVSPKLRAAWETALLSPSERHAVNYQLGLGRSCCRIPYWDWLWSGVFYWTLSISLGELGAGA